MNAPNAAILRAGCEWSWSWSGSWSGSRSAPTKESLLKALEQIIEVADASIAAATGTQPIRPVQLVPILTHGHEQIRLLARAARGDRRWGRRPSLEPLPPKDEA